MKQGNWLAIAAVMALMALTVPAMAASPKVVNVEKAMNDETPDGGDIDPGLRTAGLAMPVLSGDGTTMDSPASHIYLTDFNTGTVLLSRAADAKMYPSSMTKMMTLYLLFERLKQGTLSLDNQFTVSEKAWRMQGSKMFVPLGGQIKLSDLIQGIAIDSGNDACIVVAEGIAGSEDAFAKLMNEKARQLGMTNTHFVDASGWPNADHYTTPHDLNVLASAIIRDFPDYYHYFSEREFTYNGIRQFNRNLLLGNESFTVDGLKTGHTDAAGYGITLSAKDASGRRLVLVINGLETEALRASEGGRLLNWALHNFDDKTLFRPGTPIAQATVWMGAERTVPLTVAEPFTMSIPKVGRDKVKIVAEYNAPIKAPIKKGEEVGTLKVTLPSGFTKEAKLVAAADVEKLSYFGRIPRNIGHWFGQ